MNDGGDRGERGINSKNGIVQGHADPGSVELAAAQPFTGDDLDNGQSQLPEADAFGQRPVEADVNHPGPVLLEAGLDCEREARIVHAGRVPQAGGAVKSEEMTFMWANEHGTGGMLPPEYWEALGYRRVRRHPFWPASWLMELAEDRGEAGREAFTELSKAGHEASTELPEAGPAAFQELGEAAAEASKLWREALTELSEAPREAGEELSAASPEAFRERAGAAGGAVGLIEKEREHGRD